MTDQPIVQFNPKLPRLSSSERAVLKLLIEAGKLIAPIYLEQENQARKGSNKEEIEKAAKKNPSILSPYTAVEKVGGKLITTPYHIKYVKLLAPVAQKLNESANITDNKEFGRFLKLQAKALTEGSYEEAVIVGLKLKSYIIDFSIVPIEHLDDKLFFSKASYQAWVGIVDVEGTERLNNYKTIILNARKNALMPTERIDNFDNVKAKVIDVLLFSGLMARTKFVGVNLPVDINIVQKYGSQITLFNQPNDLRMKEQTIPTFNKIFSREFREGFNSEDLRRGSLRYIAMHELAHSYLYYKHASENLQDLFQSIYELAATVLGMRMAGSLLLKDRITEKQLESMIVTFLCRSFYLIEKRQTNKSLVNYVSGSSVFINFMLESGALRQIGRMAILNFMKIFISLHDLSNILEGLLSSGTRKDAEAFIKKYGKPPDFL